MTILCLASYEKGHAFLRQCHRQGARVLLITSLGLKDTAKWPLESIAEIFYMPDTNGAWDRTTLINSVSHLARTESIDRIVALDDFDVELAASLREHLRVPGMGETTVRYFRDKLAMRVRAAAAGIRVPAFVHALNRDRVREFMDRVPAPWVLKPRSMAGAIGIRKIASDSEFQSAVDQLGDMLSHYLLEQFIPGDIFHVDSIIYNREIRFAIASGYGRPPMEVAHDGGIFTSRIVERDSATAKNLLSMNADVMRAFRMVNGVSHTEFIRSASNSGTEPQFYFLETSARVGGAHVADLVEAATGLNLWSEWAKVELAGGDAPYDVSPLRQDYTGLLVSLAKQEHPDTSTYNDPELVWRIDKPHHVGFIVRSPELERVKQLIDSYTHRVQEDFWAFVPAKEKPGH
jgi:biotin carboxylase